MDKIQKQIKDLSTCVLNVSSSRQLINDHNNRQNNKRDDNDKGHFNQRIVPFRKQNHQWQNRYELNDKQQIK